MREVDRIVDQLKRAFEGGAWHGPSLTEALEGLDAKGATARPVPAAHSIWEIVLHLIGSQELVVARMQGNAKELTPEEDWPVISEVSERDWQRAIETLRANDEQLRSLVAAFADENLGLPLVPGGSNAYDNLHGTVQHNLYHAGQIAILKKQLAHSVS